MKNDYVTAYERLSNTWVNTNPVMHLPMNKLVDYANHECVGCGRTSEQISLEEGWTDFDFDSES